MDDECFFIFIFRDFRPPPKYVLFIEVILYVIPFWTVPGRCITWEMGGSQFAMSLCTGLSQTPDREKGKRSHCHFSWCVRIPSTGSW